MRTYVLATALLLPSVGLALTPDEVRNQYPLFNQAPCTDNETGEQGHCFLFMAEDGNVYLVFTQSGEPVFVRFVRRGQPYEEVWRMDNSVDL
jgi:hypothetical protein